MKIIGLDVGSKTIGVAVSDALGMIAHGIQTIAWDEDKLHSADQSLQQMIETHEIRKAVIGLPKHMNGTLGERGEAIKRFAEHFKETFAIETILWDERLSTVAAERTLIEADMSRKKRKQVIDQVAAAVILQGYLDQQ